MSIHGWEDFIPIAFAMIGLFTVFRWTIVGAAKAVDAGRRRRASGPRALVARIDGLEQRMDNLETGVVKIIGLLEGGKKPTYLGPAQEKDPTLT